MYTVIKATDLGKKYFIRHQSQEKYISLRDVITSKIRGLGKKNISINAEEFWALNNINFEINQGDRVGIIGRNGAGKSTLLKVLSRITEPSKGKIELSGRVASLLEVGTGFHPELTGKENIYLNGAILGMSKSEIKRKFDEIVDFAEVERFLDTPVKRYSSGMYVRLAFSVAAHLEPEILIIDEVLAVGDAQFQKKCLGKMKDVSKGGRTLLFVSHNMGLIEQLCQSVILLDKGAVKDFSTDVRFVINEHLSYNEDNNNEWINNDLNHYVNEWITPLRLAITDSEGKTIKMPVRNDADMWVQIEIDIKKLDPAMNFGFALYSEEGFLLFWSLTTDTTESSWPNLQKGIVKLKCKLPKRILNEGIYRISMIASLHYREWLCNPDNNSPSINIIIQGGLSESPYWTQKRPGQLAPIFDWLIN